jgi:uncharacterized protein (DUF302 family)
MRTLRKTSLSVALLAASTVIGIAGGLSRAEAQEPKYFTAKGDYEDIKFQLSNAIVERGLTVESTGALNEMLKRTGPDVGSTKVIYKSAEFLTFCSARYSRRMMEADPANIAFCPYVIFIYEAVAKPGEIVVGYRPPVPRGSDASKAALAEIDKLLEGIAKDAVKP